MSALLDSLAEGFEALPSERVEALGLGEARRSAMRGSLVHGLPTARLESWKYTPLRALGARSFSIDSRPGIPPAALLAAIPGPRLVFVNGVHVPALDAESGGATLRALSAAMQARDAGLRTALASGHAAPEQVFASLNGALAVEGAVLEIPAGVDAGIVHLVFVSQPAQADIAAHLRHVVRLGAGARATIVEHHLAEAPHHHLVNHLMQVQLGSGAHLVHARLQDEDAGASLVARTEVSVGEGATYRRADLELGAALSRHELDVALDGAQARFESGGVLLSTGRRHLDTRLTVLHAARDTACDLCWRGLATDRSRLAFLGGITIAAGADGSDASLSAKNLLLSEGAEVDAQPVLEIHADEVKAAHGATVGRLDPTALFYLRSRGIPERESRALLTQAFCRQALAPIDDESVRALLLPALETRLAAAEAGA